MQNASDIRSNGGKHVDPEATPAVRRKLATTAAELQVERDGHLPVWIRAPRNGALEFYSGQSRAMLYRWASEGKIRSVSIRQPGQVKGVRLFHLGSLLDFIAKCETSKEAKSEGGQ
jgi:hypothetical protein